jgi:hypothetical protein
MKTTEQGAEKMSTLSITEIDFHERRLPRWIAPQSRYSRGYMSPTPKEYAKKMRCYISPAGETVLENLLVGRRNRPTDLYRAEVLPALKIAIAERLGCQPEQVKLNWSQHAGCSMCPCSPGYIVTAPVQKPLDIYVKVEAANDAAAVTAEAKPFLDQARDEIASARSQRTGRGPSGKLRNFTAMSAEKLAAVREAVISEGNDPEAMAVLVAS